MLQETSQYSYQNQRTRFYVEGRGGYKSLASHYYSHNQGERGRLLNFSGDTVGGDGRFGYKYQTIHYSSQR